MEIRVLRYFLETAREGNITRAAETTAERSAKIQVYEKEKRK